MADMKFGMAAPYQSAEIWAVVFQENHINCCHQISDLKAKMHQNRFRLGLHPRPRWGSLQRSPRSPSWILGILLPRERVGCRGGARWVNGRREGKGGRERGEGRKKGREGRGRMGAERDSRHTNPSLLPAPLITVIYSVQLSPSFT